MTDHAVLIAGGGPTGLMLAGELALAGVDVAVIERRGSHDSLGARASGLHARTIEVFDQRGIGDRFVSQGQTYPVVHFHVPLDLSDFPSRRNYVLGLWQHHTERILAEWVAGLPVRFYREREATGFTQDDAGVTVHLADGSCLTAEYLVGCDGGRSAVRRAAGIEFPGWEATTSWLIVEAEASEEPAWGWRHDARGSHAIGHADGGPRRIRAVLTEANVGSRAGEPTFDDIREAMVAVYGTDFGIHSPSWISRFTDMTRQAAAYRDRRVLLAGDAAHVHAPIGGQGLNLGVQDAVNLGWKVAQVVRQTSPDTLLDTYQAERHPVAARVMRGVMALAALRRSDEHTKALGECVSQMLAMDEPRKRLAGQMSGLDIHYDLGDGHPLLGHRMPDLDLVTVRGPMRVFTLLHGAKPVLISFGARIDIGPWADRVPLVGAEYSGTWELPVLGMVPAPNAVLVRPDGYVAWVGDGTEAGLADALTAWFGPPHPA